jgi:hypothetical protein
MDAFDYWCQQLPPHDPQLLERLREAWDAAAVEAMRMVMRKGGRERAHPLTGLLSPEPWPAYLGTLCAMAASTT